LSSYYEIWHFVVEDLQDTRIGITEISNIEKGGKLWGQSSH
jgi:hypothetical protein